MKKTMIYNKESSNNLISLETGKNQTRQSTTERWKTILMFTGIGVLAVIIIVVVSLVAVYFTSGSCPEDNNSANHSSIVTIPPSSTTKLPWEIIIFSIPNSIRSISFFGNLNKYIGRTDDFTFNFCTYGVIDPNNGMVWTIPELLTSNNPELHVLGLINICAAEYIKDKPTAWHYLWSLMRFYNKSLPINVGRYFANETIRDSHVTSEIRACLERNGEDVIQKTSIMIADYITVPPDRRNPVVVFINDVEQSPSQLLMFLRSQNSKV